MWLYVNSMPYGNANRLLACLGIFMEFYYLGEVIFGKPITLNQAFCGQLISKLYFTKFSGNKYCCKEGLYKIYDYDINKDGSMTVRGFSLVQKPS